MNYAVETKNLTRIFRAKKRRRRRRASQRVEKDVTALKDVNLRIKEGELFGLLGPNGAGKTTLIKILCTLLLPTSGKAFVAGNDVEKDPYPIRRVISMVSGGEISGYGLLTTRENLWMFSQFYGISSKEAKRRIDEMLEVFGDALDGREAEGERDPGIYDGPEHNLPR
jgi:ABC-2 type transport system ATP-binding protein